MNTIVVVEDNEDNRMLMEALLEDRYAVEQYESGPSALEALAQTRPDLVLLDISLPTMDGTEVLARLRQMAHLEGLPVVALTAHAMVGDRERFLNLGFDAYVAKPIVDEDELFGTIDRLIAAE